MRQNRCSNHRSERGVGAEHEDSARAEYGIRDQGNDRCIQPVDGGEAGGLAVGHADGDQHCGEHEAGIEIRTKPL
jgi:hypothetical protein